MMTALKGRWVRKNCLDMAEIMVVSSSAMLTSATTYVYATEDKDDSQSDDFSLRRLNGISICLFKLRSVSLHADIAYMVQIRSANSLP
jgi:hypothetical protein